LRKPWQSVDFAWRNYERTKGKVGIGQGKEAKEARAGGGGDGGTGREGRNERGQGNRKYRRFQNRQVKFSSKEGTRKKRR
jgi:hypothetical protein